MRIQDGLWERTDSMLKMPNVGARYSGVVPPSSRYEKGTRVGYFLRTKAKEKGKREGN